MAGDSIEEIGSGQTRSAKVLSWSFIYFVYFIFFFKERNIFSFFKKKDFMYLFLCPNWESNRQPCGVCVMGRHGLIYADMWQVDCGWGRNGIRSTLVGRPKHQSK